MQELLTRFEREGDLDLMRSRARADAAREIRALLAAVWQWLMTPEEPLVHGLFTPAH